MNKGTTAELARVVQETVPPEHVTVWLRPQERTGGQVTALLPVDRQRSNTW